LLMAVDLEIKVRKEKNIPVITLSGEIDVYTYPKLNEALAALIEEGCKDLVINLEQVKYIDSTGLGVLANSAAKLSGKKGNLHVVCTKTNIKKIFDVSGLLKKNLKILDTEANALELSKS
jgi:anti-sigma B factor antagonist